MAYRRLQQVEQELREVKVAMHSLKEQPNDSASNSSYAPDIELQDSANSASLAQINATLDDVVVPTLKSIGSVQLSAPVIKELLTE